jgi:hypothetical protein
MTDGDGQVQYCRGTSRRRRARGVAFRRALMAKGTEPCHRPFPLRDQAPATARPDNPREPPQSLVARKRALGNYTQLYEPGALRPWDVALQHAERNEAAADGDWSAHRARGGTEVRVQSGDFTAHALEVFDAGFTFVVDEHGRPPVLKPKTPGGWGIKHDAMRAELQTLNWRDQELGFFLEWGVLDYSENTPRVSSFSPNHQSVIDNAAAYGKTLDKEVTCGWAVGPRSFPFTVPAFIRPGGSKMKRDGTSRNLVDAS